MKNPRTKIIFIIIFTVFLLSAGSALALEAKYPVVPGLPPVTDNSDLGDYVGYFFGLAMYIAGILAVISFTIGAIQIISSASSPDMEKDGKDRMKGAVLGLVLTLSAFVILKTINPSFVTPTLTPLPGVAGIFYAKGSVDDLKAAPMSEPNVPASATIQNGYNQIYYKCTEGGEEIAPTLLIWKFPKTSHQGNDANYSGVTIARKKCGELESVSGSGSFKMDFETPGIYYFLQEDCAGYMSGSNTTTQDKISEPFTAKIRSVKIVNDPAKYKYYGAIFHNKPKASDSSDCTLPVLEYGDGKTCYNLYDSSFPGFSTYSAEIFNYGRNPTSSSGDGVWFYGNVNGWDSGNKSGVAYINSGTISAFFEESSNSEHFRFDYTGVATNLGDICKLQPSCRLPWADPDNCCFCATPKDWSFMSTSTDEEIGCGGSIRFGGNGYLVTLYTNYMGETVIKADDGTEELEKLYCQSFKKDTANLSSQGSFLPPGRDELNRIIIIPIH